MNAANDLPITPEKPFIEVELTPEQQARVKPLVERARHSSILGKKAMLLAQIFDDRFRVGFIDHTTGLKVLSELRRRKKS